jgi:hypothetical protein|tara:strand:- start:4840 stop:5598 length:759 start_codon:yes stop_codon:yes gene_type:complete
MISYIIPTLWKSDSIYDTINQFMDLKDNKAELIIIDNTNSDITYSDKRVKVCKMEENQYVNPSWNIGVDLSSNDQVAIINDDITFNVAKFHQFVLDTKPKALCIINSNKLDEEEHYSLASIPEDEGNINARPAGGGQFMFCLKENWPQLPYDLKLWHGDDIFYYYHTLIKKIEVQWVKGMYVGGEQSKTVNTMPAHMRTTFTNDSLEYLKEMHILGIECSTVFPMSLKRAWLYGDTKQKLKQEKLLDSILNG